MLTITQTNISGHLAYACCYGLDHISHVQCVSGDLETEIEKFLQESITTWLELCVRTERYISIHPFFDWIEVSHGNGCWFQVTSAPTTTILTAPTCLRLLTS